MNPNDPSLNKNYFYNFNGININPMLIYHNPYVNCLPYGIVQPEFNQYDQHTIVPVNTQSNLNYNLAENEILNRTHSTKNNYTSHNQKNIKYNFPDEKPRKEHNLSNKNSRNNKSYDIDKKYEQNKSFNKSNFNHARSNCSDPHLTKSVNNQHNKESNNSKNHNTATIVDLDKDFPPIKPSISNLDNVEKQPTNLLDFKLALQKPKPIENKEVLGDADEENHSNTKKKRKRKRKRKPKKEVPPEFNYDEQDFPEIKDAKTIITEKQNNLENKEKKIIPVSKKSQKLQIILSNEVRDQVMIVPIPERIKQKSKNILKSKFDKNRKLIGTLNPMDIDAPKRKIGKQRLVPKIKKLTKLKQIIMNRRQIKKEAKEIITGDDHKDVTVDVNLEPAKIVESPDKSKSISTLHNKHFREYCDHMVDKNIDSVVSEILRTLIGYQDKLYHRDPTKARIKRRLCYGLREVTKHLKLRKLRLIVITPDLEKCEDKGGLDEIVENILNVARTNGIPYVFALTRSSLAYLCFKKFRVGAVGIMNYDGTEVKVRELLTLVDTARQQYSQMTQLMNTMTTTTDGMTHEHGHSRNPSNALSEPISDFGDNINHYQQQHHNNSLVYQIPPIDVKQEGSYDDESDCDDDVCANYKSSDSSSSEVSDKCKSPSHVKSEPQCISESKEENQEIDELVNGVLDRVSKMNFH